MNEYGAGYRDSGTLKLAAKESLDGKWLLAIGVCIVAWLLTEAFTSSDGANASFRFAMEHGRLVRVGHPSAFRNLAQLVGFILGGPIAFGVSGFFLKLARKEPVEFSDMFSGFSYFGQTFLLNLLIIVFTMLWTLLLIVPGIIALLKYSMAYYILYDNPGTGALEAIRRSKEMMDGNKGRLFGLWISFIGWFLLGIITFGLGMIYAIPYYRAAKAGFYQDLKGGQTA